MKSNKAGIAGWILTGLLAVLLIALSAKGKFTDFPGKDEMFGKLGFTNELMFKIGVIEVVVTLLFLIPQTAFIGAILITAYLGGAVAAHLRVDDPVIAPIVIGIVVWIALGLRNPKVFSLAFGSCCQPKCVPPTDSTIN